MSALLHALITTTGLSVAVCAILYYAPRALLIVGCGIVAVLSAPKGERHKVALDVLKLACRGRGGPKELK